MMMILKKNKMINLKNYHQKKLEETSLVPVTQEKNTNTVMDLYDRITIIDTNNIIALVI